MNGRKSRACRKAIYGEEGSSLLREYKYKSGTKKQVSLDRDSFGRKMRDKKGKIVKKLNEVRFHTLSAGEQRKAYQMMKKVAR